MIYSVDVKECRHIAQSDLDLNFVMYSNSHAHPSSSNFVSEDGKHRTTVVAGSLSFGKVQNASIAQSAFCKRPAAVGVPEPLLSLVSHPPHARARRARLKTSAALLCWNGTVAPHTDIMRDGGHLNHAMQATQVPLRSCISSGKHLDC